MSNDQQPTGAITSLEQRLNVDFALQAAGLGIWEYDPASNQVRWDERCRALFGLAADNRMSYEQAFAHVHPDDVARVDQAARWVMNTQSDGVFDETYRTIGVDDGQLRWVRFQGRVDFTPTGTVQRFAGIAQEVTQQVQDQQVAAESWAQLRRLIEATPVAMGLHVGPALRVELANDTQLSYWGKDRSALGKPFREVLPELDGQGFFELFEQAYATGQPYQGQAAPAHLSLNGKFGTYYFDYSFNPIRNEQGQVYAVLNTAINVTEQVLARQQLEESERFAHTLFEHSPVAKAVFVGPDMIIRTANKNMLSMWGKESSVIGSPFIEALPELVSTPQVDRLRRVLMTGEKFYQAEEKFELLRYGQPYTGYYEYTYEALRAASGTIYGVICVASEVTQQVLAHQQVEEQEAVLRNAVELAELGTWTLDIASGEMALSPRHAAMFGLKSTVMSYETALAIVHPADQQRVRAALAAALQLDSDGRYQAEYRILNASNGRQQVIRARGETRRDAQGKPRRIAGTAQDITLERALQVSLEQQVHQRTQELAAMNEELTASNEGYAAVNEELTESNGLLIRSNENLQTFAYIASHDLQEPLRKIQQFGDLLRTRLADSIGSEDLAYLERMQVAASRMSTLIRDLLAFSRISTQRNTEALVSLTDVVGTVVSVLDLVITETNAQVIIDPLPTVSGDAVQLGQLFQNLLSNALKFRQPATMPIIRIRSQLVAATQLPATVQPTRRTDNYHLIEVADNGIGFDEKYLDRIFQVFQRLHGKSQYVGTGVGLAICEKVVTNHGGTITASSQPGRGATFYVYLPAQTS
ncbi:PAS domain-containing sensor histidine kinase [Spirosoma rhododendri]|uniref:histidine kinase n=1 Tax=Spirosoma rhododendri TaxID=2728024 RepID=A0A7L5DTW2_9BACT|nr:PAS domain-containing protein [Spirosoma rhododendri]QJD81555.1 PAS domain-containing protein [Spirosoma rhododendri]